jgi:hypothetical protein
MSEILKGSPSSAEPGPGRPGEGKLEPGAVRGALAGWLWGWGITAVPFIAWSVAAVGGSLGGVWFCLGLPVAMSLGGAVGALAGAVGGWASRRAKDRFLGAVIGLVVGLTSVVLLPLITEEFSWPWITVLGTSALVGGFCGGWICGVRSQS